jgi:hypothetical protein
MSFRAVLLWLLVCMMSCAAGPAGAQHLDTQLAASLGQALMNSDISWVLRPENGKNYLQSLRFGIKEEFLKQLLRGYPEQKDGPWTIKELFLNSLTANGNRLQLMIGGVLKFKPNKFLTASGNFLVPAHITFAVDKKEIQFVIESKFEKLSTKNFGLNVKKIGNQVLRFLKANDQVKVIQAQWLFERMDLFKLGFDGFVCENGYAYVAGLPQAPLWVSDAVIQALTQFKSGNLAGAKLILDALPK